jgi:hypothetical protein
VLSVCHGYAVEVGVGANLGDAWHARQTVQANYDELVACTVHVPSCRSVYSPTNAQFNRYVHGKIALGLQESHCQETFPKGSSVSLMVSAVETQNDIIRQDDGMKVTAQGSRGRLKRLHEFSQVLICVSLFCFTNFPVCTV